MTIAGAHSLHRVDSGTTAFIGNASTGGQRRVAVVITPSTTTVTSIVSHADGSPGGWTARGTYTAHGCTFWLFDKIAGPADTGAYVVNFTPAATGLADVFVFSAGFVTTGPAIRAASFADIATGDTLTLPSLTALTADDLWAVGWNSRLPPASGVQRHPQAPLSTTGNSSSSGGKFVVEANQSYQSSSPTGTRAFTCSSGFGVAPGVGVLMIIGSTAPLGGWGVGAIRMGAN